MKFGAVFLALGFGKGKPGFGNVADALEFALHLRVFGFELFASGIRGDIDRRGKEHRCASEGSGQQEVVPSFFERFTAVDADVEDHDGASGFPREHDRAWLGDVARAARAIDGESAIETFFEAPGHHSEAAQTAAGGATLSRAEAEPLDDFARPLAVEGGGVHDHNALVPSPPNHGDNHTVPESPDAPFSGGVGFLGVVPAENFIAQRWAQKSNHTEDRCGDERDLDAARPRKFRQSRIIVRADGILRLCLRRVLLRRGWLPLAGVCSSSGAGW